MNATIPKIPVIPQKTLIFEVGLPKEKASKPKLEIKSTTADQPITKAMP
jgi:hypothetical protein